MLKVEKLSLNAIKNLTYTDSPSFSGIIAGECGGDIWVDDTENPKIALVNSFAVGSFSILGEPTDLETYGKFKTFMDEKMFPELKNKEINYFEFSIESEKAKSYIHDIFKDRTIQTEDEYKFRRNVRFNESASIPDGYEIFKVDIKILERLKSGDFYNHEFLSERLLESWGTYEGFINSSVAFIAVMGKRIVAVIIGTARFNNIIPVYIETEDNHRNKGLAFTLTHYLANECIDNGLIVQWDCMDTNIASQRIAKKANFEFLKKDRVYWFKI